MPKDITKNAILPTFANNGYMMRGETKGHEVNG
jgi:hypothetical protein